MKLLLEDEFYNAWLKYHNIDVSWLIENEPELIKSIAWYKKYAVTQEQYDEWYDWAIKRIMKHYRMGRKRAERLFSIPSLNLSPDIKR